MIKNNSETILIKKISTILNDKYNFSNINLQKIKFSQNLVLLGKNIEEEIIIRISPESHKNKEEIEEELYFIQLLLSGKIYTAKPIPTISNNFLVTFKVTGAIYHLVVFEKIQGQLYLPNNFNSNMLEKLGETIGKMHSLSKKSSYKKERQDWFEEEFLNVEKYLVGQKYDLLRQKIVKLINEIKSLPQTIDSYSLIHSDIHHNNFFINNDNIIIFDFEDCEFHYFISDFATLLHEEINCYEGKSKEKFAEFLTKHFWKGYLKENNIDDLFIEKITLFIKLRDVLMLIMNFNPSGKQTPFFNEAKKRIEKDIPYIDIEFSKIIKALK